MTSPLPYPQVRAQCEAWLRFPCLRATLDRYGTIAVYVPAEA